jgi:hypothetical protein
MSNYYQENNGMALTSPGVEVTVIDESFYTPAEPGTTPLIVVATEQDKPNAAGPGVAAATTKANAGVAFRITSQKELIDLFGVPFFEKTVSASPVHGGERNEYGLLAAYSLLGVSNSVFITRADVDLGQLEGQAAAPGANPNDGDWWVDTQATAFGVQEWNGAAVSTTGGQKFAAKTTIVLTDADTAKLTGVGGSPLGSVGSIGDYAVVFETVDGSGSFTAGAETARVYYKSAGNTQAGVAAGQWVLVGSNDWSASHPAIVGTATVGTLTNTDSFYINNTLVNNIGTSLTSLVSKINSLSITGITAREVSGRLYIYTNGTSDIDAGDSGAPNGQILIEAGTGSVLTDVGIVAKLYYGPALQQTPHTQVPEWKSGDSAPRPTGSVWIKTTEPNNGARWRVKRWNSATQSWISYEAPIYSSTTAALYALDRSGGGVNLPTDTLFVQSNSDENSGFDTTPATATFRMWRRSATGFTTVISQEITTGTVGSTGSKSFTIFESDKGQQDLDIGIAVTFTAVNTAADANLIATAINAAGFVNIVAGVTDDNELTISHKLGGDFRITDTDGVLANVFGNPFNINTLAGTRNMFSLPSGASEDFLVSNWEPFAASDFAATPNAPLNEPADGQLWYNPEFSDVDIMLHNGSTWVGYKDTANGGYANTDPNGPIVSVSQPTTQSDSTPLVDGDLWISTADLENFPTMYRYNGSLLEWVQLDKTDQLTEEGVLFADARWGNAGTVTPSTVTSVKDLLVSSHLDPDAPDPALYPKGMLLWNLRRSGGNVKIYRNNYIDTAADNPRMNDASMDAYATDRWTTISANNEDGSGSFGRKAQRKVVVQALKSTVDTSQEIRDEERRNFNIIACPGYPELMSNLVNLNIDRGLTAFVIGDTPLRLPSDATSLTRYGSNQLLVTDNGDDGIVTFDEYMGVFYPNGFTTDLSGSNAVVPASHMMLRTIALSDNVSYPWFAPAGTRRGGITNATAVGYIDSLSGEFQTVALNEGQRDTLYDLKINPITFFNGVGLVNYGQKTRARNASALDRINVARLVVYLRSQLAKLARPYVFEPNDKITREEVRQAVESLLLELVGLRAIYDFAVVCDETNNTPARVDRNELWVDIAIEPVKAIEFIYIPLRVKNTGEI